MINPEAVGKFAPDGSIEQEVEVCAFTGLPVLGIHSNRERVANSPYFYRVRADALHAVTDEWRAEFARGVGALFIASEHQPIMKQREPKARLEQSEE